MDSHPQLWQLCLENDGLLSRLLRWRHRAVMARSRGHITNANARSVRCVRRTINLSYWVNKQNPSIWVTGCWIVCVWTKVKLWIELCFRSYRSPSSKMLLGCERYRKKKRITLVIKNSEMVPFLKWNFSELVPWMKWPASPPEQQNPWIWHMDFRLMISLVYSVRLLTYSMRNQVHVLAIYVPYMRYYTEPEPTMCNLSEWWCMVIWLGQMMIESQEIMPMYDIIRLLQIMMY